MATALVTQIAYAVQTLFDSAGTAGRLVDLGKLANYGLLTSFTPAYLFTTGVNGAWYDPSDTTTLFRDAAGTQPVTAVEQPVGLMLDKSKGLVLGPELVTNGDFSSGSTGWSLPSQWQVINQQLSFVGGARQNATQVCGIVNGRTYEITFTVIACANFGSAYIAVGGVAYLAFSSLGITSTGTKKIIVSASGADGHILFRGLDAVTYTIDNISVRELPGNHAFNSSGNSANFPVLSARYNLLTKTEQFDDVVWSKGNATISANVTTAPDGTTTAEKLIPNSGSQTLAGITRTIAGAVGYTWSIYVKAAEFFWIALETGNRDLTWFNVSAGTVGTTSSNHTALITPVGNGWYHCSITTKTIWNGAVQAWAVNGNNTQSATGDGTSGIYIWGADLRVANDALGQPTYQRVNTSTDYDTVGYKTYLRFNGTNQWLQTNSIDFTYGDKMFVCAGVRKLSDATAGMMVEHSSGGSNPFWHITAPGAISGGNNYNAVLYAGTGAYAENKATTFIAPMTNVVTGAYNFAAATVSSQVSLRVNGTVPTLTPTATTANATNFGNYPLYIGARAGASLWFNGRLYQMVVAGKQASAAEITSTETYLNQKTGAF